MFSWLAEEAIASAKGSAEGVADAALDPIASQRRSHVLCDVLAQVALALDAAVDDVKRDVGTIVGEIVRDRLPDRDPVVLEVLSATANALKDKAVDHALGLTGWDAALEMARVGAVIVCPAIDEHPAVQACGAPLVEEPLAEDLKTSFREAAIHQVRI